VILCGPPLQRDVVETAHSIESKRGFPLWVPYAWNVRAVCRHPHLCSVCLELGLNRQHLTVQRCDVADYVQKESCSV
jgi:hypothetical protein